MLIPDTIDLSPAQASAFDQLLPELEGGFELGQLSRPDGRNQGGPGDTRLARLNRCSPNCSTRLKRIERDCRWTN